MAPVEVLRDRAFLRPAECARLFGHDPSYWVALFDRGVIEGHREGGANGRYLDAASVRAYVASLRQPKGDGGPVHAGQTANELMAALRAQMAAKKVRSQRVGVGFSSPVRR